MGLFKMLFPKMAKEFEEIDRKKEVERKKDLKELKEINESIKKRIRKSPHVAFDYTNGVLVEKEHMSRSKKLFSEEEWEEISHEARQYYVKEDQKRFEWQRKENDKKCRKIISFLKKEGTKLPASDIDFQLRIGDVDLVKELCEEMYRDKRIGRTGNYRYFV
tara:strand:- start:572 stop:1057 length:486 start_codon:yes stop_codon:yes gene_type:complete